MSDIPGLFIQLYTDEDVTTALAVELRKRGFNAQSAAEAGKLEADDENQLAYASAHNWALMTQNEKDFVPLTLRWADEDRPHSGIIISEPFLRKQFGELLRQTLHLLDSRMSDELRNSLVYLSSFVEQTDC